MKIHLHAGAALLALLPLAAQASLSYTISYVDPFNLVSAYRPQIDSHIGAAMGAWGSRLKNSASIEIEVRIASTLAYASGFSATSGYVGEYANGSLWQQGMAYEIATGVDPNGDDADVVIMLNPGYVAHQLWFDPDPVARTAPVGADRTDAMSVFIHEIGHALAFNGWGNGINGAPPAGYGSTWDQFVSYEGSNMYFNGPQAMSVYGAPVPITQGNNFHFGNSPASGRPGSDLANDLFNGWMFYNGQRYGISALDEAVLADTGTELAKQVPEPAGAALFMAALAGLFCARRRRRTAA